MTPLLTVTLLTLAVAAPEGKLPVTELAPAVREPHLGNYHYPLGTRSADCQAFCDQGFMHYYSYVWMEAARCFETAVRHDPTCAVAWLGLSRSLDKWGKTTAAVKLEAFTTAAGGLATADLPDRLRLPPHDYALRQAEKHLGSASHREQFLVRAKLFERGWLPDTKPDERKKKAVQTLDELLALYDDDQEGWFARAQLAEGSHGAIPFHKALLRVNPNHPGAHHELVHIYENVRRPALGWPHAEGYMAAAPGFPHAFHMQAHLATRLGKWQHTTDWSWKAVELERAYHAKMNVRPDDDHQYRHHLEILTRSLIHDGRFGEAKQIRVEADRLKYHFWPEWFRLAVAERDWPAAERVVAELRKGNKATAAYFAAVLALERGIPGRATAEIDVLRQCDPGKGSTRERDLRLWELLGRTACQTGDAESGLKLLRRTIDKTKDDYAHHAWGGGAYPMEVWGTAALEGGHTTEAEEAFQEALAHDPGSVRAALGLWAISDWHARPDEAARYLKLATRCWQRAEVRTFEGLKSAFAARAKNLPRPSLAADRR